jgi:hypothetical protein
MSACVTGIRVQGIGRLETNNPKRLVNPQLANCIRLCDVISPSPQRHCCEGLRHRISFKAVSPRFDPSMALILGFPSLRGWRGVLCLVQEECFRQGNCRLVRGYRC